MALKKNIVLENGIPVTYHRVIGINNIINQETLIEVGSYINEEQRDKEKEWYKNGGNEASYVFFNTVYYSIEYNKDLNVDNAYEYLKTLEIFEGAEDVFEKPEETPEESTNNEEN